MNKYGILLDDKLFVLDIAIFQDKLPDGYLEISEYDYITYKAIWKPWSQFLKGVFTNDPQAEKDFLLDQNIKDLRNQLRRLHIEIGLAERMQEGTKDLLAEFERVKVLYNNLTNNNQ